MKRRKRKQYSIVQSFGFAFEGLYGAIKSERNMRIHISVMVLVLYFMKFYQLSLAESGVVLLTFAVVIALELVNTAIEAVTDKASPELSCEAKIAKDTAAAAVLIAAVVAVFIGVAFFFDLETIKMIFAYLATNVVELVILIILVALLTVFVVGFKRKDKGKGKNNDK